eukprot:scaffold34021_cov84-Isochrysis_galbana.AAC.1
MAKRLTKRERAAAVAGLRGAATCGELLGFPLHAMRAEITSVDAPQGTSAEALGAAAAEALSAAVAAAAPVLLEPIMDLEVRAWVRTGGVLPPALSWRWKEPPRPAPLYF